MKKSLCSCKGNTSAKNCNIAAQVAVLSYCSGNLRPETSAKITEILLENLSSICLNVNLPAGHCVHAFTASSFSLSAAMSIFMLLIFEVETGIASACVLSSGILILLLIVIHSLVKACRRDKRYPSDHLDTLYHNNHGGSSSSSPLSRPCELKIGVDKPRMHRTQSHIQHPVSFPHCGNPRQREQPQQQQQQQYSPARISQGGVSDRDGYCSGGGGGSYPRMHRTLSTESGLLQAQAKPWNGVNNEMRSVLARKSGITAKDSTLVWPEGNWGAETHLEPPVCSFTENVCILNKHTYRDEG